MLMPAILLILAIGLLLIAFLASMTYRASCEFSKHELGQLAQERRRPRLLGDILQNQQQLERTAQTVRSASLVLSGILAAKGLFSLTNSSSANRWLLAGGSVMGLIVLAIFLDVWLAAPLARLISAHFLVRVWRIATTTSLVLAPLNLIGRLVESALFRLSGGPPQPSSEESLEEEIRTIVTEGQREGLLEEDAREMIEGVMEMGDVDVGEIMTPRTDMLTMPVSTGLDEAAESFVEGGHSRIPITDKNRDDIVGILYIKDLLAELIKPADKRVAELSALVRQPVFVPESKHIDDLLQEFQHQRNHMAIVLNEFGGVAGLVTIEDILEEIVGEIVDEHDEEVDQQIRRIDQRTAEVPARTRLEELNEELGLHLEETGVDTIGGFVFSELGHVPRPGEQLLWKNVRLTVLAVRHRRVERVRIEILDEAHSEPV